LPKSRKAPKKERFGFLTKEQLLVLKERSQGLTQVETAKHLGTTRANVSMLELRAKKNLEKAAETLRAYESSLGDHKFRIEEETRLRAIPPLLFKEGDRFGIHLHTNLVEIVEMVKAMQPPAVNGRLISRDITATIGKDGKVSFA
jgi:HTH-type transcriptional regulator, fmd operon transcriptional regulator